MVPNFTHLGTHERSAGWSLKALMELYKVTYDRKYLQAAEKLANITMKEQKFDKGGAWPHKLPRDHSGYGNKDAFRKRPFSARQPARRTASILYIQTKPGAQTLDYFRWNVAKKSLEEKTSSAGPTPYHGTVFLISTRPVAACW